MAGSGTPRRGRDCSTGSRVVGAAAGAIAGALLRGAITYSHLREGDALGLLASLPSAGIGFLCGAIGGCWCRGLTGALIGAGLSAGMFLLVVLPVAFLATLFNAADDVVAFSWPLFLEKGIAGGVAGGFGGGVGGWMAALSARKTIPPEAASPRGP